MTVFRPLELDADQVAADTKARFFVIALNSTPGSRRN